MRINLTSKKESGTRQATSFNPRINLVIVSGTCDKVHVLPDSTSSIISSTTGITKGSKRSTKPCKKVRIDQTLLSLILSVKNLLATTLVFWDSKAYFYSRLPMQKGSICLVMDLELSWEPLFQDCHAWRHIAHCCRLPVKHKKLFKMGMNTFSKCIYFHCKKKERKQNMKGYTNKKVREHNCKILVIKNECCLKSLYFWRFLTITLKRCQYDKNTLGRR